MNALSKNNHALYVETGIATVDQIKQSFRSAIEKLNIPCKLKINLVSNKNGSCGFAYIWVTSSKVFFSLIGKNFDGTELCELIDDPNWEKPEKTYEEMIKSCEDKKDLTKWSNSDDDEDIKKLFIPNKIKKKLPPLVEVPGYKYNDEQLEYLKIRSKEKKKDEKLVTISEYGYFEIGPSYMPVLDENLSPNILIAKKVPEWITYEIMKKILYDYVTDSTTLYKCSYGKLKKDTYPHINFIGDKKIRSIFVTFSPYTEDGKFALLFLRKLRIIDPKGENPEAILYFTHSYNVDNS